MAATWARSANVGSHLAGARVVQTESRGSTISPSKGPSGANCSRTKPSVSGLSWSANTKNRVVGLGSLSGIRSSLGLSGNGKRGKQQRGVVVVRASNDTNHAQAAPKLGDDATAKPETPAKQETTIVDSVRRFLNAKPKAEAPISYAQLLEHLQNKRVVRLSIHDHGKEAIGTFLRPNSQRLCIIDEQPIFIG
eukprot:322328-Prorocentrum_minimum.AAC.5